MSALQGIDDCALYYPSIEFADEVWLRGALCVWDTLYRIVPSEYSPMDSEAVQQAVESGAIRNITVGKADLGEVAVAFEEFWETVPVRPAGVTGWSETEVRLHPEKVDARIRPLLMSLARCVDPEGWLRLSKEVAGVYMLFLAETVSRRRRIPKLTDNPDMFAVMHYFTSDGNIADYMYDRSATEFSTALIIETLLPADLERVSMTQVLDLQEPLKDGRRAFRTAIASFAQELAKVEDAARARELAEGFRAALEASKQSTLTRLGEQSRDIALSFLAVGVPTAVGALSAFCLGGDVFELSNLARAGLIGAVASLADVKRVRRSQWAPADASYYLDLQRSVKRAEPARLSVPKFDRFLEEFIND